MKRIITVVLSLAMVFSLTACGKEKVQEPVTGGDQVESYQETNSADTEENTAGEEAASENTESVLENAESDTKETKEESASGSKVLIVYFSRAENINYDSGVDAVASASINADKDGNAIGNLRIIAEYLQEETKGDLFSIHTEKKYPKGYRDTTDQAADEKDADARPKLSNKVDNMEQYTTILLGYPNWWGTIPMPVATFLEEYDFAGKTIIPFASHEGSGLGSGPSDIKKLCPDAEVEDGFAIRGGDVKSDEAKSTVADFVKGLDL